MTAAKALDKQISEYLPHLNIAQKEAVLKVVKTFAHEEDEWWGNVEEAAKESIERGMKQAEQGKTTPHKAVMKNYKKWLSK